MKGRWESGAMFALAVGCVVGIAASVTVGQHADAIPAPITDDCPATRCHVFEPSPGVVCVFTITDPFGGEQVPNLSCVAVPR